ncbi:uncharacterized protein LOC142979736 isoform X2 [Anticarsia gemmatalis]|uniref:uncharacterized protein LOC142979736 isoform X2 n=1 Tax=Anticarsia gemmatalis TaxID=129554 RepID=UPI003F75B1BC
MLQKWKLIINNWLNCYFDKSNQNERVVNIESLLNIISHLRENLNLDESKSSVLEAHTVDEFLLEKYPEFKLANGSALESEDDIYLVASLLLFFVCVNSKDVDIKSAMCSKLSGDDQETILKFSKSLMECSPITCRDVQAAITEACGLDMATIDTGHAKVAETPPALRSLHGEVRRLQAALDAERFDRNYLQEELARTNLRLEKLVKDKEQYKLDIVNLKAKISLCCGGEHDARSSEAKAEETAKLARQLQDMEERLVHTQEMLDDAVYDRDGFKAKVEELKQERDKWVGVSQQERDRACQLAEELDAERRHMQSLRELVTELRQHNRLNGLDTSQLECDDPDASMHSLAHNLSVCSEACANVVEVQLGEERAKVEALKQQIQTLQDQIAELNQNSENNKQTYEKVLHERENEVFDLKHRINEEIEEKNNLKAHYSDKISKLNNEMNELEQRIKDNNDTSRHIIESKLQEIQTLQEEKLTLLHSLSDEITKLNNIITSLQNELETQKQSQLNMRDGYENKLMKINEKVLNRNNELVELQNTVFEKGEAIENLQMDLRKEREQSKKRIDELSERRDDLEQKYVSEKEINELLNEDKKALTQHLAAVESVRDVLLNEKTSLEKSIKDIIKEKEELLLEKEGINTLLKEEKEARNRIESEKNKLELQLNELNVNYSTEIENKQAELGKLMKDFQQLHMQFKEQEENNNILRDTLSSGLNKLIQDIESSSIADEMLLKDITNTANITMESQYNIVLNFANRLIPEMSAKKALQEALQRENDVTKELRLSLQNKEMQVTEQQAEEKRLQQIINDNKIELTKHIETLKTTIENQQKELQLLQQENQSLTNDLNDVKIQLELKVHSLKEKLVNNEDLTDKLKQTYECQIDNLNVMITKLTNYLKDKTVEFEAVRKEKDKLQQLVDENNKVIKSLEEQVKIQEQKYDKLVSDFESERQVLKNMVSVTESIMEDQKLTLNNTIAEQTRLNDELLRDNNNIKQDILALRNNYEQNILDKDTALQALHKELAEVKIEKEMLNNEIVTLKNDVQNSEEEVGKLKEDNNTLAATLQSYKDNIVSLEETNAELKIQQEAVKVELRNDIDGLTQTLRELIQHKDELNDLLKEKSDRLIDIENKLMDFGTKIIILEEEKSNLIKERDYYKTQVDETEAVLETNLTKHYEEITKMKKEIMNLTERNKKLNNGNKGLVEKSNALRNEMKELAEEIGKLKNNNGKLTEHVNKLKKEITDNVERICKLKKDNKDLVNNLKKKQAAIKSFEEQIKTEKEKYDKLVSDSESERQVLKNMVSVTESIMEDQKLTLNNTIAEQTRLNDELLRDNNNIKQDILALRNNYEQNILDKDTALQALHKELIEINLQKEILSNEIETLKNDVQDSEEQVGKLKKENNQLATSLQSYKDTLKTLGEEVKAEKLKHEKLTSDFEAQRQVLKNMVSVTESIMEDQKLTLNNTIAEQTRLNDELLRDNNNIKQDILALRNNYEQNILDKDTALQALHKELAEVKLEKEELIKEVNSQKEALDKEIETLKSAVQRAEDEVQLLREENKNMESVVQKYKENVISLEEENSELKIKKDSIEVEFRNDVEKLTKSLQEQMENKKLINMQLQEKSDNIIEMENKLKCLEEKNNILEEEKSSLMSEKESLQGKVNEIETVLETNENRFTEEIIKLKNNSALLAENIEKNNSDSTSEINRLKTLNTALENEKDQLMQSNSDLILQVNSLKQNITDFEAQVKKLMEKNTELEEEIDKLKVNNNEIAKQVDILEAHNNELREEVNQLTNNNTKLLNNVECLKKTNTELTEQIELLNKTNNEWSDEIDQLKEDKTKLTKEVTQLNENISELKEEIDDLTDNNIELKKDIEQLKVNDNKLAVEVDKLMEKKIELTEEIDELKLSNTEAAKEINRLKKHNSDLLDEVDHLIGNKSEYESEIDKLKEQISEQSKELVLLKDHNKELTEEIEELIKNNTGMEVEIDKLRANSIALTENVDGLKGNNEELEKEIVQLKETNTKLGQEVIQFSEKNAELTEAMDKVKNDNRDQVERLNKENSEHLSENVQLKENITSLQQHITKLENGNKEIQEDMSKLRKYNTELAEEIGKLNKKKTELLEQLVQLNIVNKDLTDRLETMEKDYIKLGVTIKEKQSVIANLELAVSDSRQQNEKLRENNVNEKVSLVSKCDILENYHTKAEKELEERQKEIVSLQKEVQRLQAKVELCEEDSKAKDGFISKMSKDKDVIINNVEKELLEEKQSREKCQKKLEEKILLVAELKQKLSDINNEREALNILKKQNEDLIKAIGQRDTFAVRSQELTSCQKYSGHSADKDLRDLHHQVDNTSDLTHSSMESLKTITDLEKIIHDKNRTITALQTDVTYLKSVIAESETKLLDVTKELEVSKENCHQLSAQLKKIVHQKNEEIAELKKQVNKMSVTENRATQIIKVSAKYQAIILKRIAEIKSNTVLKELTNYGNTNNNCDNDLRRSLTAGTITMEDLENFLETTERHLKKCSEKQLALQKERDRLSELNRINESENINLKKFLTELSVSFQTISSVKDMYAQKLSRVVSLQRTVRRELLSLDGQLTDAASLRLERGYAAVLQDLAEAATTLQRWLERAVARAVSAGRIEQALLHDAERPALAPGALTSAGLDVQLDELEQALQRQLEDAARARRGDGARDPPALTVLEVRAEYEDKLNRMKAKMKQLYTEQIAVFKEKQKEKIATLERELARARDKLAQSSRAYEQHIRGLTTELWAVGEKFLTVKEEAAWFKRRERSGSLMSLQHVHSSGLVPTQEEPGRPSDTHSLRSLPVNNDVPKREGRGLHMSDEEGEVFDNRWLKELSATPRRESRGPAPGPRQSGAPQRLSELRWRNSLCPPHLKSSYPAETQFAQALDEEEIKATGASSTATQMPQRKEVGITAYKKPGPPTPSKQAGRLSATDSELRESLRVEAEPYPSRKTSTPSRLRSLFRSSKTENTEGTPRSRRLSNIFRKK